MSFGSNLEQFRKAKKVSQASLGASLGLTQQMISSYEKDLSSPNVDVLVKLADYFNISIDALVGHTVNAPDSYTSTSRFLRYFMSLTEIDKERCILIIKTLVEDRNLRNEKKRNLSL